MDVRMVLLTAMVLGCAETATAPPDDAEALRPTFNYVEEGDQEPPPGTPPEYAFPTVLYSVDPSAGYNEGYGWAQVSVSYFGTHGLAKITVNTNVGSQETERQDAGVFPMNRSLSESASIYMGACGGTIGAVGYGKVWNETPLGALKWGTKSDTRQNQAFCPTPPPPSGGGGGGGGGGSQTCYTLQIDHYWYYPDTGQIEYRYSSFYQWCEGDAT